MSRPESKHRTLSAPSAWSATLRLLDRRTLWKVIAKEHGVHPGTFNKTRVWLDRANDKDVYSALWGNMLCSRYGVPQADVNRWRSSDLQWGDMVIAATIAKDRGVKPDVVFTTSKKSKDWNKVWKEHPGKAKSAAAKGKGKLGGSPGKGKPGKGKGGG